MVIDSILNSMCDESTKVNKNTKIERDEKKNEEL